MIQETYISIGTETEVFKVLNLTVNQEKLLRKMSKHFTYILLILFHILGSERFDFFLYNENSILGNRIRECKSLVKISIIEFSKVCFNSVAIPCHLEY